MSKSWRTRDGKLMNRDNSNESPDRNRKSNSQKSTPNGSIKIKTWEQEFSVTKTTVKKGIESPTSLKGGETQTITIGSTSFHKVQKYSNEQEREEIKVSPLIISPRDQDASEHEVNTNGTQKNSPKSPSRFEKLKRVPVNLKNSPSMGKIKVRTNPTMNTDLSPVGSKGGFPKRSFKKIESDRDKPLNNFKKKEA